MLRRFYEYALELETALCRLLSVLSSPEMSALQHLATQQVQIHTLVILVSYQVALGNLMCPCNYIW